MNPEDARLTDLAPGSPDTVTGAIPGPPGNPGTVTGAITGPPGNPDTTTAPSPAIAYLTEIAVQARAHAIRMASGGGCFLGSALSCVDLLAYLHVYLLRDAPGTGRGYFLLSKGHAVPALYGVLAALGRLDPARLANHLHTSDDIYWHPNRSVPGVDFHSGSLGHSLPVALGLALDLRRRGTSARVFVLAGDGELDEGSMWESILLAASHRLGNLCLVVDRNGIQANLPTESLVPLEPLAAKFEAFGWHVREVDGHDFDAFGPAFVEAPDPNVPLVVLARTVRGKGLPSHEGRVDRWFVRLDEQGVAEALAELDAHHRARGAHPSHPPYPPTETARGPHVPTRPIGGAAVGTAGAFTATPLIPGPAATGQAPAGTYEADLLALAAANPDIVVLTAENRAAIRNLPSALGAQFLDFGICEQSMVGAAAGLALRGRIPVVHALAAFLTMRAFEFIRTDLALPNLPALLVGSIPGFLSDANGPTHQAIEDVGILRTIPNLAIVAPADERELRLALPALLAHGGPCYVRFNPTPAYRADHAPFVVGKAERLREGHDLAILSYGFLVREALGAADLLERVGLSVELLNLRTLAPVDAEAITEAARRTRLVVTLEDHVIPGGLASIVAERLIAAEIARPLLPLGLERRWFRPGLIDEVLAHEGFTADAIAQRIERRMRDVR